MMKQIRATNDGFGMRTLGAGCAALVLVLASTAASAQEAEDEGAEDASAEDQTTDAQTPEEEALELSAQVVTGTRLIGGDPSTKTFTFSAEEMSRRGVSSVEGLFRMLPYSFSSTTTQTNTLSGSLAAADTDDTNLGELGLGTSTINLRAMGSGNTLVLVDGRRIAGKAGSPDNFANVLNVPMSAIERVDIQLDGASAVYGSDAIGGVVNFILRKDYVGYSASVRNEWSATGADRNKIDLNAGWSWGSGNVNASLSRTTSKPVDNWKIFDSWDLSAEYGEEFDLRPSLGPNQPGLVCDWDGYSFSYISCSGDYDDDWNLIVDYRQLASGGGQNATPDDFGTPRPIDYVSPQNGEDSTNDSLYVNVEQYVTDSVRAYASVSISMHDAYQEFETQMHNYLVPASNAYNPYGVGVIVSYYPLRELQEGVIPSAYIESENEQHNYAAGFFWEIGDTHQLQVDLSHSKAEDFAWQIALNYGRSRYDPSAEAFYRALDSSDPNVALNLFGDGSAQGSSFEALFANALGPSYGTTTTTIVKPILRGDLFDIRGGPVRYVVGLENERRSIYFSSFEWSAGGLTRGYGSESLTGIEEPTTEITAGFAELALPLLTPADGIPAVHQLNLSLQLRRDRYEYEGASGGVSYAYYDDDYNCLEPDPNAYYWSPNEGWTLDPWACAQVQQGSPNIIGVTKAANTWRVGVHYEPNPQFSVQFNVSKSFKPPVASDFLGILDSDPSIGFYVDPYHPDGEYTFVELPQTYNERNMDLKSEFSDNYRVILELTPDAVSGLTLTADWSMVDFTDKIQSANLLIFDYPEVAFAQPEIVVRDADGYPTRVRFWSVNLAEKINEMLILSAEYSFGTPVGDFFPRLTYSRVLDEYFKFAPGDEPASRVGTIIGSNEYHWEGSVTWIAGRFAGDLFGRYVPKYSNIRPGKCVNLGGACTYIDPFFGDDLPELEVPGHAIFDLTLTYELDNGLRIRAGGKNIFDKVVKTVFAGQYPYDPTRWDARGRVMYMELRYER